MTLHVRASLKVGRAERGLTGEASRLSGNDGQGHKKANHSSRIPDSNHAATSLSHDSTTAASNSVEPPV